MRTRGWDRNTDFPCPYINTQPGNRRARLNIGTCGREPAAGENFDAFTCLYDNERSSLTHENHP
jgi:hypothetical protein